MLSIADLLNPDGPNTRRKTKPKKLQKLASAGLLNTDKSNVPGPVQHLEQRRSYNPEEEHFILYHRVVLDLNWKQLQCAYNL